MTKFLDEMIQKGYVMKEDVVRFEKQSQTDILGMLYLGEPFERTIAVKLLVSQGLDEKLTERLLAVLETEKSFFTKMEIHGALKKGGEAAARLVSERFKRVPNSRCRSCEYRQESAIPQETLVDILVGIGDPAVGPLVGMLKKNQDGNLPGVIEALTGIVKKKKTRRFEEITEAALYSFKENENDEKLQLGLMKLFAEISMLENYQFLSKVRSTNKFYSVRNEAARCMAGLYGKMQ